MKIFISNGLFYRKNKGVWELWAYDHWVVSHDALASSPSFIRWLCGLQLIGNNFRLK